MIALVATANPRDDGSSANPSAPWAAGPRELVLPPGSGGIRMDAGVGLFQAFELATTPVQVVHAAFSGKRVPGSHQSGSLQRDRRQVQQRAIRLHLRRTYPEPRRRDPCGPDCQLSPERLRSSDQPRRKAIDPRWVVSSFRRAPTRHLALAQDQADVARAARTNDHLPLRWQRRYTGRRSSRPDAETVTTPAG